jgi:DnaK suppressor protein
LAKSPATSSKADPKTKGTSSARPARGVVPSAAKKGATAAKAVAKPVKAGTPTATKAKPAPAAAGKAVASVPAKSAANSAAKSAAKSVSAGGPQPGSKPAASNGAAKGVVKSPAKPASGKPGAKPEAPVAPSKTASGKEKPGTSSAKLGSGKVDAKADSKGPGKPDLKADAKGGVGKAVVPPPAKGSQKDQSSKGQSPKDQNKLQAKDAPKAAQSKSAQSKAAQSKTVAGKSGAGASPAGESAADGPEEKPAGKAGQASGSAGQSSGKAPSKSSSKAPSKKKGPIDLATAKSVAAVAAASQADSAGYVLINGRRVRMISTKGLPAPKRAKVAVEKEVEKTEPPVASIKTKLNKKELDEYKALLMLKRRQLVGMLHGMEDEALRSSGGNLSTMPLHMADIGTDTFDQDFTLGMAETERALLDEIDAALGRIENKTYGVCQLSGKPIPKARLEAKPWAKYSIEAAKLLERGTAGR